MLWRSLIVVLIEERALISPKSEGKGLINPAHDTFNYPRKSAALIHITHVWSAVRGIGMGILNAYRAVL